jgi:hypothetical protein
MNSKLVRYLQKNNHYIKPVIPIKADHKPVENVPENDKLFSEALKLNEGIQKTSITQQPDIMKVSIAPNIEKAAKMNATVESNKLSSINFGAGLDYTISNNKKGRRKSIQKSDCNNNGTFNF